MLAPARFWPPKLEMLFLCWVKPKQVRETFCKLPTLAEKAYRLKEASELKPDDYARLYNLLYAGNSPLATEVRKEAESFEISFRTEP